MACESGKEEQAVALKNESDKDSNGTLAPFKQEQVPTLLKGCPDCGKHKKGTERAAADRGTATTGDDISTHISRVHCGTGSDQKVFSAVARIGNVESQQLTGIHNVESQRNNFSLFQSFCFCPITINGQFISSHQVFSAKLRLDNFLCLHCKPT